LHGWLGWTLLAMIIGHIGMTLYHRRKATEQDVLPRMAGKLNDCIPRWAVRRPALSLVPHSQYNMRPALLLRSLCAPSAATPFALRRTLL
jgi:hypothetical protein